MGILTLELEQDIQLDKIASKYDMTGAMIASVMHYAALRSLSLKSRTISFDVIIDGIRKEFQKEEKSMH